MAEKNVFVWEGKDVSGKKISGQIEAISSDIVKILLRKQGILPTKVVKRKNKNVGGKPITPGDIALFARQLSTMMKAGVPLVQSFSIVAEGADKPALKSLITSIKMDVESGLSFGEAISKYPDQFDDLFCNLVIAGEQAGALESLLDKVATYKEKSEALKNKIQKALKYPISILAIAAIVTGVLLIFVVPVFQELFEGFGAELPQFTQFVIGISDFVQSKWYLIIAVFVAIIFSFKTALKKSKAFNHAFQRFTLKAPIAGEIIQKASIARFSRTLSTMSAAGVPLVEALDSSASVAGNIVYYQAIKKMELDASTGVQLNASMKQAGIWPNMVIQMIAIGEESGALDDMLTKVADYYETQVDDAVDGLTAMMEPMIMAFLGVVVGGLVLAMYLPIFAMGDVVG
jgi:type IV pilus assembly protein PilC